MSITYFIVVATIVAHINLASIVAYSYMDLFPLGCCSLLPSDLIIGFIRNSSCCSFASTFAAFGRNSVAVSVIAFASVTSKVAGLFRFDYREVIAAFVIVVAVAAVVVAPVAFVVFIIASRCRSSFSFTKNLNLYFGIVNYSNYLNYY